MLGACGVVIAAVTLGGAASPPAIWLAQRAVAAQPPRVVLLGSAGGAVACASCHGVDGEGGGRGAFPRLAGQEASYLAKQLDDYRSGRRRNAIMEPMARGLTVAEIDEATRWYAAARPAPTQWGVGVNAAARARGERVARTGEWSRGVPACVNCHGPSGEGVQPHFPALRGQSPEYIAAQFVAFRNGWRTNDSLTLMRSVARRLTDADARAVAAYFAALGATDSTPGSRPLRPDAGGRE